MKVPSTDLLKWPDVAARSEARTRGAEGLRAAPLDQLEPNSTVQQGVLADSQISITMNTYSHISEAQSREAADRMGDLFQFTSGGPPLAATLAAMTLK